MPGWQRDIGKCRNTLFVRHVPNKFTIALAASNAVN
jgi:hypothetical protein